MKTIGVDIGGTKIAAGVVAEDGTILASTTRETDPTRPDDIEASVAACVSKLRRDHEVSGVGIAAAGFVSADRATILFAPNIDWRNHPLAARIHDLVGLPVVVENDANAAAWAEYRHGAARGARDVVMLTLGTGLGGAIISDGRLVRGAFGAGAEMGHIKVNPGGHRCGCGQEGCWEAYVSGTALSKAAGAAVTTRADLNSPLIGLVEQGRVSGIEVTAAARSGDRLAVEVLNRMGWWLGYGLASVTAAVDPGVVVIGGGIAAEADLFLPAAHRAYLAHLSGRGFRGEPTFAVALLGNEAGVVGAAAAARDAVVDASATTLVAGSEPASNAQ